MQFSLMCIVMKQQSAWLAIHGKSSMTGFLIACCALSLCRVVLTLGSCG
jgi:hypothetical protein